MPLFGGVTIESGLTLPPSASRVPPARNDRNRKRPLARLPPAISTLPERRSWSSSPRSTTAASGKRFYALCRLRREQDQPSPPRGTPRLWRVSLLRRSSAHIQRPPPARARPSCRSSDRESSA